jgi:hypothetical protein
MSPGTSTANTISAARSNMVALWVIAMTVAPRNFGTSTARSRVGIWPVNFAGFRKNVIEPGPVRIIACLNISFAGINGFSKNVIIGESGDPEAAVASRHVGHCRQEP